MLAGLILFCIVILFYGVKIFSNKKAIGVSDFFEAGKNANSESFINSSVAYGYQVAALALFANWGFQYGFWTIWVPMFWGLGFYLLYVLNCKGYLDRYYRNAPQDTPATLHSNLGGTFGSKWVRISAALFTMLGLSGTAFFEAEYTGKAFVKAVPITTSAHWFLAIIFVLVTLFYVLRGGFRSVMDTDKFQLKFGFVGFNLFIVFLIIRLYQEGYWWNAGAILLLAILCLVLLWRQYRLLNKEFSAIFPYRNSSTITLSLGAYCFCFGYIIFSELFGVSGIPKADSFVDVLQTWEMTKVGGLGWISLISLLLANGLWQLVDISNWQRISSLRIDTQREEVSKALKMVMWYSPITWIIAIALGLGLKKLALGQWDGWDTIGDFITMNHGLGGVADFFNLALILSLIFVMSSTLDSLLSSISFTAYRDIFNGKNNLKQARGITIGFTIIFFVIYYLLRKKVQNIDSILYTFYSIQLSLFPTVMVMLFSERWEWLKVNATAATMSIFGGALLTLIPLMVNTEKMNPYSTSAIFSVVGSSLIYLIFMSLKVKKSR